MKIKINYTVMMKNRFKEFEILIPCSRAFANAYNGKSTCAHREHAQRTLDSLIDIVEEMNSGSAYTDYCIQIINN